MMDANEVFAAFADVSDLQVLLAWKHAKERSGDAEGSATLYASVLISRGYAHKEDGWTRTAPGRENKPWLCPRCETYYPWLHYHLHDGERILWKPPKTNAGANGNGR